MNKTTFSTPRFLKIIDLTYLIEGVKVTDQHFDKKVSMTDDLNEIGNLNTTRQSLLRAAFISAYSIFEQNLDEIVQMESENKLIKPGDLKDSGINRSIKYAQRVLDYKLNLELEHWRAVKNELQEIRNHLVHYGDVFSEKGIHSNRIDKFMKSSYITYGYETRFSICFTFESFKEICEIFTECIYGFDAD